MEQLHGNRPEVNLTDETVTGEPKDIFHTDPVRITYYTDPLCCWSWALDHEMQQLQAEFRGKFSIRYCMGGLISSWKNFSDEKNSVYHPSQLGAVWRLMIRVTGVPADSRIWVNDPPSTSYLSCTAVKCAGLQSPGSAERYLHRLRIAVMLHGRNISRKEILFDIARQMESETSGIWFDSDRFIQDFERGRGDEAFRKDMDELKIRNIHEFPTLTLGKGDGRDILIAGYRKYPVIRSALIEILESRARSGRL